MKEENEVGDIGESEEVKADLPGMIKPSFSQTGHRNRLDSVHSPTQPLPTFNLMVVYLILRPLLTHHTEVGAKRGGGRRGCGVCVPLFALSRAREHI